MTKWISLEQIPSIWNQFLPQDIRSKVKYSSSSYHFSFSIDIEPFDLDDFVWFELYILSDLDNIVPSETGSDELFSWYGKRAIDLSLYLQNFIEKSMVRPEENCCRLKSIIKSNKLYMHDHRELMMASYMGFHIMEILCIAMENEILPW